MAFLIRAPLSALDDDEDDDGAGTGSSFSSGASSPDSRSPSPPDAPRPRAAVLHGAPPRPRAAVLHGAPPRVSAQISSAFTDDEGDVFDDAADFGDEDDEVLDDASAGFFRVARVPPPPPSGEDPKSSGDEEPAAGSASASEREYFGAVDGSSEEGFADATNGLADDASAILGGNSVGVDGSFDGSFRSSRSVLETALSGDLVTLSDSSMMDDSEHGNQDFAAKDVCDVVPGPIIGDADGIDDGGVHAVDSLEGKDGGSERDVAVLFPVVDSTEEDGAGLVLPSDEFDAVDATPTHEVTELPPVVNSVEEEEDADLEHLNDELGDQDVAAKDICYVVPEPFIGDAPGIDDGGTHTMDASEGKVRGSEHGVAVLSPVVDSAEEDEAGFVSPSDEIDAVDTTPTHEVTELPPVVNSAEEDGAGLELHDGDSNETDNPCSISEEVDGETQGDYESSASMPISETNNAAELLAKELEDDVDASKGTHFGLDDSDDGQINDDDDDDEELNGDAVDLFDYAALAELLKAANRSPGQGKAKVFPVEKNMISTSVLDLIADVESDMTDEEKKLYKKLDMTRIKYLRLVHRLKYDTEHRTPIQVLYRLSLVEGFRRIRVANRSAELENAWKRALQLEAEGIEDLEFSCNVLVLGKAGVGKSATINSIFGENRSKTDAFLPATSSVKEIVGIIGGVKFCVMDTPGLGATVMDEKSNRKVLSSVKKSIKRCPPDIVLYVDRLNNQRQDTDDRSLMRCITSVLGVSIWSKTIIALTHSGAAPPEGPSGSPVSYEIFVTHRTRAVQQSIWQATHDPQIQNTVSLVENHDLCRRNREGEKVLPDGTIWRRELLLLCYSLKIVSEIDSLSTRRAPSASAFGLPLRTPPLPYFLSSLLQSREHPWRANDQSIENVDSDVDLDELLNRDQDDEDYDYNQLPPFKPLSKSQVSKLPKEQQKLYFDEYDYRTKLLHKMQFKEQLRRLKEMKLSDCNNHNDHPDDEYGTDRSAMPDWTLPSSFDSDNPVYRYRYLEATPNLLLRAVTNPEGWDHDCGFDGVSLQHSLDVADTFPASLWVQVNKDKKEFTINLESSISAKHHRGHASSLAGFDIQTMMDQLAYTFRGETKLKNFKKNTTTGGLSMTFLGDSMLTGAKFEDKLSVGNRLTLAGNTGAVTMKGDTAYGVNMEATLREKDYPMGQGLATLGASLVRWHKEWTVAANLDSQFSVGRNSNMGVHLDMNNKLTGRVSIKANTSEQLKISLLGICSTAVYLWNRMHPCADPNYE